MPRERKTYEDFVTEVQAAITTAGGEIAHNALIEAVTPQAAQHILRMSQDKRIVGEVKATATPGERAILTYRLGGA